jgi:hypothetical protein
MSFDFDAAVSAPFRMQPGLRRIAEGAAQLTPNVAPERGTACHLREKLAVLQAFPTQALLSRDAFDAWPALDALARHAAQEHPQAFALDTMQWRAPILGWDVDQAGGVHELAPDRTPWPEAGGTCWRCPHGGDAALLSLAFAEDFAIIDGSDGTIPWLAVALPSLGASKWVARSPRCTRQWPTTGSSPARVSFRSMASNRPCLRSMSRCSRWRRPSPTLAAPRVCTMRWRR